MQEYLRENVENVEKKRVTFESRLQSIATAKLQSFSPPAPTTLNYLMKAELCEQEIFKIEREIEKKQEKSFQEMKRLTAEVQESEITSKEFNNIIDEMKRKISAEKSDPKTNKSSSQNFIEDLMKNCAVIATSIRMKSETTKSNCRKLNRMVMKREELSSCLQPVDFELVTLEKEKFKKVEEEKNTHFMGLNNEVVSLEASLNSEQKEVLKAKMKFDEVARKKEFSEKNVEAMKLEVETLQSDIDDLKESIRKLSSLSDVYEAPSVTNYIAKIAERDALKQKLKALERKNSLIKNSEKIAKQKFRDCKVK